MTNDKSFEGSVPLPDFSQGRPYTESELGGLGGVTVEKDTAGVWARRLGLEPSDVLSYRFIGGVATVDGSSEDIAYDSLYVVHRGLKVPIRLEERQDGKLVRHLTLMGILPVDDTD